jgi:hypothetical protein
LHQRHLHFFTHLAEAAEPHILGAAQATWLNRPEAEHDNCRAALQYSLEAGNAESFVWGLRLAAALGWFWHLRGHWPEGRQWLQSFTAPAGSTLDYPAPPHLQAKALCSAGLLAWAQDELATATNYLTTALDLTTGSTTLTRAHTAGLLGLVLLYQTHFATAEPLFAESLALFRALDNTWGIGVSLIRLALVARFRQDWFRARQLNQESLAFYRRLDNAWGIATSLANLAEGAVAQGNWQEAARQYREAYPLMRSTGSEWYMALLLMNVAAVAALRGWYEEAAQLSGRGAAILEAIQGSLPPLDRWSYEHHRQHVREQLGEAGYAAAYHTGRMLTPAQTEALLQNILQEEDPPHIPVA